MICTMGNLQQITTRIFALACGVLLAAGCNSALGIGDPTVRDSGESSDVSVSSDGAIGGRDGGDASPPGSSHDSGLGEAVPTSDARINDAGDASLDTTMARPGEGGDERTRSTPEGGAPEGGPADAAAEANTAETSVADVGTSDSHVGCANPPCTPVLLLSQDAGFAPRRLAQDDTYLYWTQLTDGFVGRTNKITGETTRFFQGGSGAQGIATDDASVYWVARAPNSLSRCPKSGCDAGVMHLATAGELARGIALDERNVYWTDQADFAVRVVSKNSTDAGSTILWQSDAGATPFEIATDGQRLYVTGDDGKLYVLGADGGLITSINAPGTPEAVGVALDDRAVYWTFDDLTAGTIYMALKSTLSPIPLASSQKAPNAVVTDGTNLYWTNFGTGGFTGSIMTCPISSCSTPTVLANGLSQPVALVVDDTSVYWADNLSIWKVDK